MNQFLSTPSVRRATLPAARVLLFVVISIHALRAEGDRSTNSCQDRKPIISIHALRAEGDKSVHPIQPLQEVFLSTPSVRRATR